MDFDSQNSLNDEDIANLVKWGMNFVRLGVTWESVERTEGHYDEAYLDKINTLINKLGDAGIYTLIDAHQDVFGRMTCGEGFPNFYQKKLLEDGGEYCLNEEQDKKYADFYKTLRICTDMHSFGFTYD